MRKFKILSLLIVTILCVGCSSSNKRHIYLVDMSNYSSEKIELDIISSDVEWSSNNKYFFFIDIGQKRLRVFEAKPFNEIQIPDKINDKFTMKSVRWIDENNSIYIRKYKRDEKDNMLNEYYSYNLVTRELKEASQMPVNEPSIKHRSIGYDTSLKMQEAVNESIHQGSFNMDQTVILYNTKKLDVYLYDVERDKNKFLFKGFNLWWSPDEKKIVYCVPKNMEIDRFSLSRNYGGDTFDTYIYDVEKQESTKILDYFAFRNYFSPDGSFVVIVSGSYLGLRAY